MKVKEVVEVKKGGGKGGGGGDGGGEEGCGGEGGRECIGYIRTDPGGIEVRGHHR